MSQSAAGSPAVTRDVGGHRYTISVDGEPAGFTEYADRGDQRIFVHTVVDDAFSGQGLGSVLARFALDDTRSAGKTIVPVCPFIAAYVARHHDWDAVIAKPTVAQLAELAG
jgi:predicted GNAT family acetyltransferase